MRRRPSIGPRASGGMIVAAATLIATLAISGCAVAPRYDADTAGLLQQHVLDITTAGAEGDWKTAETRLLELEADAREARSRGLIGEERLESIVAAAALVRTRVEAELAAEAAAAEAAARAEEQAQREAEAEAARQAAIEDAAAEARRVAAEEAERRAQEEAERQERENDDERGGRGRDDD